MKSAAIVKIITKNEEDISAIIAALNEHFAVAPTSAIIFDEVDKKYHRFVSVSVLGQGVKT